MAKKKPIPKTQRQISQEGKTAYLPNQGISPLDDRRQRPNQRSVKNDNVKDISITLLDIDEAVGHYLENIIQPTVYQNEEQINVPVMYGTPERWHSVQNTGWYRDKNGKIQAPVLMFKRIGMAKNRNLSNKLDGNQANNFYIFKKKYNKRNIYDRFSVLLHREPSEEFYPVVVPDFVDVQYTCIIFTDYLLHNNSIVEAINFASDSYWGEENRYKFRASIDSFDIQTVLEQGEDRYTKTQFTLNVNGYIIPNSVNKHIAAMSKFYSKSRIDFRLETVGTLEELEQRANTPEREAEMRFFDQVINSRVSGGSSGVRANEVVSLPGTTTYYRPEWETLTINEIKGNFLLYFEGSNILAREQTVLDSNGTVDFGYPYSGSATLIQLQ